MGRSLSLCLPAALVTVSWIGGACAPSEPRAAAAAPSFALAEAAIEAAIERGEIPGAVLLVGRGERVLHCAAYGRRALAPEPEAMTVDTLFDLASLTKVVATATSVMRLVEAGRVRLDAPVAEYLPRFGAAGKDAITVEHLLLHQGGLIPDNPLSDYEGTPEEALARVYALEPRAAAGTTFTYTDVGYIVLAEMVRAVDGRPIDVFAAEEVFVPLGMTDTGFRPDPERAARCAPTEEREGRWMRGEVHDPRAWALGGVAGHAGLFSTAADLSRWCRAILAGGSLDGARVLAPASVAAMTRPRWLADGTGGRALGFDVDTGYSSARGAVFPRGASFGHTGFTGTSLWLDPGSAAYVILLTNRVHPDGEGKVVGLRRAVASAVARALHPARAEPAVLTGVDVLARGGFRVLAGRRVGLISNVTGRDRSGARTADVLVAAEEVDLVALFSPEHGFQARLEGAVDDARDAATGLAILSLYGETRRPTAEMLAGIDTLVFDIQDVGTRFYTYASTLGHAMQAAAEHGARVVVLDRPNPITGTRVAGPCADEERLSFVAFQPIPLIHGMTMGELALLFRGEYGIECELEVVPMRGWRRGMWWDETGLTWANPSPNMRNPTQALLYPGVGLLERCNLSVGRGTDQPFELLGAPWIDGPRLAAALQGAGLEGVSFTPVEFTPDASRFQGEVCRGLYLAVTDREALRPVEMGLAIAWQLNRLFGADFEVARVDDLMLHRATWEALLTGPSPDLLPALWEQDLADFRAVRARYLLYE